MKPEKIETFEIVKEAAENAAAIEALHQNVFGPGRFARAAFRIREKGEADPDLCFTAFCRSELIGSVRLTPINVGEMPAFLLGPLCVLPSLQGCGVGKALVRKACEATLSEKQKPVILVGDFPYYSQLGFEVLRTRVSMPGPVDPARLLVNWLDLDLDRTAYTGQISAANEE